MSSERGRAMWSLGGKTESQEAVDDFDDDDNDDDEDDGTVETGSMSVARNAMGGGSSSMLQNRRRELHTQAEQKRRDAIKRGYEELAAHIPSLQGTNASEVGGSASRKASKSAILSKSVDLIRYLEKQRAKQRDELDTLRKEVQTLTSIKRSYETIARAGCGPSRGNDRDRPNEAAGTNSPRSIVTDEQKMAVFGALSDELYRAFDATVSSNEFDSLVSSVVLFVESNCTPQRLRTVTQHALQANQREPEPR